MFTCIYDVINDNKTRISVAQLQIRLQCKQICVSDKLSITFMAFLSCPVFH